MRTDSAKAAIASRRAEEWWRTDPDPETRADAFPETDTGRIDHPFAFWCLVTFTFVLLVAPQNVYQILQPFRLAFVSGGLALGALVIHRLGTGASLLQPRTEYRLTGVFVVLALLSIPFSLWPGGSFGVFSGPFVRSLVFFVLLAELLSGFRRLDVYLRATLVSGIVLSGIALAGLGSGDLVEGYRMSGGWSGLAENPNDFALTLNLLIPFALARSMRGFPTGDRLLAAGFLGVAVFALLRTYSRGGIITLAAVLVVWVWNGRRHLPLVRVLLSAVFLAGAAALVAPEGWSERILSITDFSKDPTGSAGARWEGMRLAAGIISRHPITGVGLGMNVLALNERTGLWGMVHNVYLEIGADLGIPAMVVFVALLLRLFRTTRPRGVTDGDALDPRPHLLLAAARTSLVAFCVAAMFHPVSYHFYFYFAAGLALAASDCARRQTPGSG